AAGSSARTTRQHGHGGQGRGGQRRTAAHGGVFEGRGHRMVLVRNEIQKRRAIRARRRNRLNVENADGEGLSTSVVARRLRQHGAAQLAKGRLQPLGRRLDRGVQRRFRGGGQGRQDRAAARAGLGARGGQGFHRPLS